MESDSSFVPSIVNLIWHSSRTLRHETNLSNAISPLSGSLFIHLRWLVRRCGLCCMKTLFQRNFTRGSLKNLSLLLAQFSLNTSFKSSRSSAYSKGRIFLSVYGKIIVKSLRALCSSFKSFGTLIMSM